MDISAAFQKKVNQVSEIRIDPELELDDGALFIQEIGIVLSCPITTITKGLLIYHHFRNSIYELRSDINHFVFQQMLAAVALNLSIKICNDDIKMEEVVLLIYKMSMNRKIFEESKTLNTPEQKFLELKCYLTKIQYFVCSVLAYKLNYEIAHEYMYLLLTSCKSRPGMSPSLISTAALILTKLLSTFYSCKRCIHYSASKIATAFVEISVVLCMSDVSSCENFAEQVLKAVPNREEIQDIIDDVTVINVVSTVLHSLTQGLPI